MVGWMRSRRAHGPRVGRRAAALIAAAAAATTAPAAAQTAPDSGGATLPRRVAAVDSTQAYALFLPPGHGPDRRWPAVVLLDPRGRALVPLERFRDAARRRGYVLISSYDSSSDEPESGVDTRRAVEVLLNETMVPLSLDPQRIYLAGFSGTARIGWSLAVQNPGVIAGVAGFGAGIPGFVDLVARTVVPGPVVGAYFGGAGLDDFNYLETRETESRVRGADGFSWVRYYPGPHAWPPAAVAGTALEWFDLHAQRAGHLPRDGARSADRVARLEAEAAALVRDGRRYEAWRLYDYVATGFEGLADVSAAERERERLAGDRAVRRTVRGLERWARWESDSRDRVRSAVEALMESPLPSADDLARRAGLPDVLRTAASADTLAVHAAERQIALLLALTTFYRFRELLEAGEPDRAVRALELAHRARPDAAALCFRFRQVPEDDRPHGSPLAGVCAGKESGGGR